MNKSRVEAFSDGVIAIIITIMVLELKPPHGSDFEAIKPLLPTFLSYIISFCLIGIYWGNHHHLFHTVKSVTSGMIWANLHLLFWLSLIPFATAWMGENNFSSFTVSGYSILQAVTGLAYYILLNTIKSSIPENSPHLAPLKLQAKKGLISFLAFGFCIPMSFVNPIITMCVFLFVSVYWWIPDRNIEKSVKENE